MSKRDRENSAELRRRRSNNTPFKGTDPFSKTAATAWSIPGTIAKGFGDVASGKRKVNLEDVAGVVAPAALAAAGLAVAKTGAGRRAIKAATPLSPRIAAASRRVAARSKRNAGFLQTESDYLMKDSYKLDDQARKLSSPEFAGTDYYTTRSRQTDPLFDTWEHESVRFGSGESASSVAQRLKSETGRKITSQRTFDYGMSGVRYRLDPTEQELSMSRDLSSSASQQRRQASSMRDAAANSQYRSNPRNASAEIRRRLAKLRAARKAEKTAQKNAPKTDPKTGMIEW